MSKNPNKPLEPPPAVPVLEYLNVCGYGGMSVVWRAHHRVLDRVVAVKVLDREFAHSPEDIRQFMTEGRTMAFLDHPGIVHGYGVLQVEGRYLYIMDYVEGYSVGAFLQRKARFPEVDAHTILVSVAQALDYAWAHFRMVHCDLKPENLMICTDGSVKITDLGLAREITSETQPAPPPEEDAEVEIEGTPAYMSPEQIRGDVLDCRSDIYSLGAALYHLVTGRLLFPQLSPEDMLVAHLDPAVTAPDPRKFVPTLSAGFVTLLANMLVKDRDRRYCSWRDVLVTLNDIEADRMIRPPSDVSSIALAEPVR